MVNPCTERMGAFVGSISMSPKKSMSSSHLNTPEASSKVLTSFTMPEITRLRWESESVSTIAATSLKSRFDSIRCFMATLFRSSMIFSMASV